MHSQAAHTNSQGTSAVQRLRLTLAMAEHVERIGARIRAKREELGLSRRKLAQKMAGVVTENDIYRWERGQHKPGDDKLEALALALEVDVSYFMLPEPLAGTPDLMDSIGDSQLDRMEALLGEILARIDIVGDSVGRLVSGAVQDASRAAGARAPAGSARTSGKKRAAPRKSPAPRKRTA